MSDPVLRGICAALMNDNIDTDLIIPSARIRSVSKTGHGAALFAPWRYRADGAPIASFVLNRAPFSHAIFLAASQNFGCGSSREFAVWALQDFGIKAIFAQSFGTIFHQNCLHNGLYPVCLSGPDLTQLVTHCGNSPISFDIRTYAISFGNHRILGRVDGTALDPATRRKSLEPNPQYDTWHQRDAEARPWLYR